MDYIVILARLILKIGDTITAKWYQSNNENGLNKYMPIGSVITITGNDKYIMIIGFGFNFNNNNFDYIGCYYPYGISEDINQIYFNHVQIDKVYNIGYINATEQFYKANLTENSNL